LLSADRGLFVLTDNGWSPFDFETEPNRTEGALAFDPVRGQLVIEGGTLASRSAAATFTFDGDFDARPAHVLQVNLDERSARAGSLISALEIRATAGGRGHGFVPSTTTREDLPGLAVLGWGELWRPLGESDTGDPDAPAELAVDVTGAALDPLTRGDLYLALTPQDGQGPGGVDGGLGRLATSRFEVTVVYRE
jgi:hypothetical protein